MSGNSKNVLVIAYACEPNKGSEAEVGWTWSRAIAEVVKEKGYNVYVLTRANNREPIEQEKDQIPPNLHFIYYDTPYWMRFWKKRSRGALLYYQLWQIMGILHIKKHFKHLKFKVIHHVTFVNDYLPSFGFLLKDKDSYFIWGPMGSNFKLPKNLFTDKIRYFKDIIKTTGKSIVRTFNPLMKICLSKSDILITISEKVEKRLFDQVRINNLNTVIIPAINILPSINEAIIQKPKHPFKIVFAGNFINIKNPLLVIEIARILEDTKDIQFLMIGKGPLSKKIKKMINTYQIENKVKIIDWMPRNKLMQNLRNSHILLFPSFEEGGMVTREAIREGCLPMVLKCTANGEILGKKLKGLTIPCNLSFKDTAFFISKKILQLQNDFNLFYENQKGLIDFFNHNLSLQATKHVLNNLYSDFLT